MLVNTNLHTFSKSHFSCNIYLCIYHFIDKKLKQVSKKYIGTIGDGSVDN
jgi:hypothetical protein